jgi:hypothetical protein
MLSAIVNFTKTDLEKECKVVKYLCPFVSKLSKMPTTVSRLR